MIYYNKQVFDLFWLGLYKMLPVAKIQSDSLCDLPIYITGIRDQLCPPHSSISGLSPLAEQV